MVDSFFSDEFEKDIKQSLNLATDSFIHDIYRDNPIACQLFIEKGSQYCSVRYSKLQ
jgi:hypothetical protein